MRILIAGIGNIFFGDDAFGVEVTQQLLRRQTAPEVRVEEFGIRGYDLAYAMMDGYDATILVDASHRDQPAGTLYLIELDPGDFSALEGGAAADAHSMNPAAVLRMVQSLGGEPSRMLYLVACEPSNLESEDGQFGLSEAVQAAVPQAVEMVEALVRNLLHGNPVYAKGGEENVLSQ